VVGTYAGGMGSRTDTVLGGRYRLGDVLGRGGMAEVYDGFDERLHRSVAIKVLRPEMAARTDVRRRFEAEARAAANLSHPNVVAVFDTGEDETGDGSFAWIVMERLPGETLADRMGEPLDVDWVIRVAGDVLGALEAAHAAGIIHRDIKPGNILLGADGCAKVADFGIAKSLEVTDDATHTGQLIGTPAYLAPERIDGRSATRASDIYAVGVVLYEALAGRKPFRGTTPISVAYAVHHAPVEPLTEVRPDIPAHVAAAIHRAMDRNPERRFDNAAELARALRSGTSGVPSDATVLTAPVDATMVLDEAPTAIPPPRGAGNVARRAVVGLVVALLALMVLGMSLSRSDGPADSTDTNDTTATRDGAVVTTAPPPPPTEPAPAAGEGSRKGKSKDKKGGDDDD
jgi:eukaryotic-like serine/threonine-protein kinase